MESPLLPPMPVPTGSDHYYLDRLGDFLSRCPDAVPPTYYLAYGDKCLHQFRRTQPALTVEGQRWVERTLVELQDRMESTRAGDPSGFARLEHDSAAFERMAFDTHSEAYIATGFAALPVRDLWKIVRTPDVSDMLTLDGLKEMLQVAEQSAEIDARTRLLHWVRTRSLVIGRHLP